jgi:hypothetical protein
VASPASNSTATRLFSTLLGIAPHEPLGAEHLTRLNHAIKSGALGVQAPFVSVAHVASQIASLTERLAMAKSYGMLAEAPSAAVVDRPVAPPLSRKLFVVRG